MVHPIHPNVIAAYDVQTVEGQLVIAMEFVQDKTLRAWLDKDERDWKQIRNVYLQAAQGLNASHRAGLVHRDFKP